MKQALIVLSFLIYCVSSSAQEITSEQARSVCAQEMASFTKAVSFAYQKGMTFDDFKTTLCSKLLVTNEGLNQMKVAYGFLAGNVSSDVIIRTYNGKEIAASMNFLLDLHNKGFDSDGAELFGGKTGSTNSGLARASEGCKWYQVWCLMQEFANWVVANWNTIKRIIYMVISI